MSWLSQEFNLADYYLFDRVAEGMVTDRPFVWPTDYSYKDVAQRSLAVCTLLESARASGRRPRLYRVAGYASFCMDILRRS